VEQFQLARFNGKRCVLFGEVMEPRHRRAAKLPPNSP
jgi:hypothetical protein